MNDIGLIAALAKALGGSSASGGGGLVVHISEGDDKVTLDKTWGEIFSAFSAGTPISVVYEDGVYKSCGSIASMWNEDPEGGCVVLVQSGFSHDSQLDITIVTCEKYVAATENDYPSAATS